MSSIVWFVLGGLVGAGGLYAAQSKGLVEAPTDEDILGEDKLVTVGGSFTPAPDANPEKTSMRGMFRASYSQLVAVLGEPHFKTNNKSSDTFNEWRFRGKGGVYTLYDLDRNARRAPNKQYEWHVGAEGRAADFKRWLKKLVG